jgi:hypothetical protein
MTRLDALQHLLTGVLEDDVHGKPWRLVHFKLNVMNVVTFARLERASFEEDFEHDPGRKAAYVATRLDDREIDTLVDLQEWVRSNKNTLTAEWSLKTPDDFTLFQNGLLPAPTGVAAAAHQQAVVNAPAPIVANPAPVVPITSLTSYGLKRDLKDYTEIKERHYFTSWMDSVRTVAILHNSDNPLDRDYTPVTAVEMAVFRLDNTYMYAVANKTVKYPSGKTIIATHKKTMDGQAVFKALNDEATGTTVRQINETKLTEALKAMDANPDKWGKTMEEFVDAWLIKASQLDDVRGSPLPDDEKKTIFVEAVKHHPVAIAAIQQQEGIEKVFKRQFPHLKYVQTFDNLIDDIRMTCQQYDNVHGENLTAKKAVPVDSDENIRRANAALTEAEKSQNYEKYKVALKASGLWVEPDIYNTWTPEQKQAHTEQAKAKRNVTSVAPAAAPVIPTMPPTVPPPQSYATMVAGQHPMVHQAYMTVNGRMYKLALAHRTSQSNGGLKFMGSLVDGGCNGGLAGSDCQKSL